MVDNSENSPLEKRIYGMNVSDYVFNRIDKHVKVLSYSDINRPKSKSEWLVKAIEEKLDREKDFSFSDIPKKRHFNIPLNKVLSDLLESRIEKIKKFRDFYSRKQWIFEAIQEKMEREEKEFKKILEELEKSF